jgi:hypothetical protein
VKRTDSIGKNLILICEFGIRSQLLSQAISSTWFELHDESELI